MGQAKLRGSFEDRKQQSIAKAKQVEEDKLMKRLRAETLLTDEQKAKRARSRTTMSMLAGVIAGMNS